jgi:hypothetical protein
MYGSLEIFLYGEAKKIKKLTTFVTIGPVVIRTTFNLFPIG